MKTLELTDEEAVLLNSMMKASYDRMAFDNIRFGGETERVRMARGIVWKLRGLLPKSITAPTESGTDNL